MASKCVIQVQEAVNDVAKAFPVIGKLVNDYQRSSLGRLLTQSPNVPAVRTLTEGVDVALEEASQRFARQADFPEAFTRPGDVPVKAEKGKIYKREAQQAEIMNQYGLAAGYARLAGLTRGYLKGQKSEINIPGVNLFYRQLDLHDFILRGSGVPLITAKAGALKGTFHFSYLTFGDIVKTFVKSKNLPSISKYFLRSPDATKNIQSQNTAEAVRRILEHGDTYGKIDLDADFNLLKAEVTDALRNPSGLGRPRKNTPEGKAYDEAIAWANSPEGIKLTDELADELLSENMIVALIKGNEEMRMITAVMAKGDGLTMAEGVLKMITDLPNLNDRIYAYGDLLFNDRFRKMFTDDALVKMTPEELNLAFGENFLAQFFNELTPEALVAIRTRYKRGIGKQKDIRNNKKAGKTTKSTNRKENTNRVRDDETATNSASAATKAADEMEKPEVVVQEASLEAAQKARQYQLEFEVGPLLGGTVRAFNWASDKLTMGGKMKTSLVGAEHFRLENAATMTAQLAKLFKQANQDTAAVNAVFASLQRGTPLNEMTEAQRALAKPLSELIENVFGFGSRNNLDMNGIFAVEFQASLKKIGLGDLADELSAYDGYADDAMGEWWKSIVIGEDQNALTVMAKVYSAMQLSRIKPTIADTLRHHFSHTSEGLTFDQAVKLGYQKLADTNPLAEYINIGSKPVLFHPDVIKKMAAVNAHLDYERGFSGNWQKFWNKVDPTIGVFKSSLTIWRPGHHMVSLVGNTIFNALYGVSPNDYGMAMRMLAQRGDILDLDETALTQALREGTADGYKLKGDGKSLSMVIGGKVQEVPLELLLRGADEIGGVPISPRRTKDLPNDLDPENFAVDGWVQRTPGAKQIASMDHGLAKVAAVRDNVSRYALYVRELRRGGYNSIEDAILAASQKVHEVHPTVGTLTAAERKYARRAFYFYTWQKQALFKILELAANQPAIITVPSKLQYALATASGLNPESFGDGWDPEGLYASYFTNSVFAPQQVDPTLGAVGVRPASPQLDVIDAFLSKVSVPAGLSFWEGMGSLMANTGKGVIVGNATPLFKVPAELATGTTTSGQRIDNIGEYLLDQSGLGGITRMFGYTPWGEQRSDFKEGEYGERDRERQVLNYWTGIKSTYYQSPASVEIARRELIDYWQRIYKYGKYAEDN